MQNLQLPLIQIQSAFYLRQLTVNLFCIHNEKTGNSSLFLYPETVGGKGPNEVCSFLLNYITNELPNSVTRLHLFSDGCGRQNKNHTMIRLMCTLTTIGRFQTIDQYFPLRGHLFLSCDRDFSVIKRTLRKFDRVYSVKDYAAIILDSSAKKRFSLQLVQPWDLLNFKSWWPQYYKRNVHNFE